MKQATGEILALLEGLVGTPCPPISPSEYLSRAFYAGLLKFEEAKAAYLDLVMPELVTQP